MVIKKYKIDNIYFEIKLDSPRDGMLRLPIDWKLPTNFFKEYIVNISETEFDRDMLVMLPISFGDDWMESCFDRFQFRVKFHMDEFKRITPGDLECYVAELILIFHSIGNFINQPFDQTQRQTLFKKILIDVSETLNIPVELNFAT